MSSVGPEALPWPVVPSPLFTEIRPRLPAFADAAPGDSLGHDDLLVPGHNSATIKVGRAGKDKVTRLSRSPLLTKALGPTPSAQQGHA